MKKEDFEKKILAYTLANALSHEGKAQAGAVLPKLFQEGLKKEQIKEIMPTVQKIVKQVNSLIRTEQEKEFESLKDIVKQREEKEGLPELPGAKKGRVITAFPPEPSGYPHIGHAKGALINFEYSIKYDGKFILRFEDTNPELAKKEFYKVQLGGYHWLGLKWDKLIYVSDTISEMYAKARELIKKGHLYACDCSIDKIRNNRMSGKECSCRKRAFTETMKLFNGMLDGKFDKGQIIIRWMGDMDHKNTAMRDPVMFRIIKEKHARQGRKFIVWPSYDFAAAYSDGVEGITHRIRSKEFELRAELQKKLQQIMGFKQTMISEQARFNLKGVEASKRKIREKIEAGELIGWDDPRLATLTALRRRGFRAEAIKNFLLKMGITKHESILEWKNLEAENKKIIDVLSNRYFFIENPVKIKIKQAPKQEIELNLHPQTIKGKGGRKFKTHEEFCISKEDFQNLKQGKLYRLMDCLNFIKKGKQFIFVSQEYEKYKESGKGIFHWLPVNTNTNAGNIKTEVMMPDAKIVEGLAEEHIKKLKVDDVCQFERFGFCRLDKKEKNKIIFWFSHK